MLVSYMLPYALLQDRARIIQQLRQFFISRGYLEVFTPLLSDALIPESGLEVMEVMLSPQEKCYLTPSPEYWMKQLLAHHPVSIFEITHSFRKVEEQSPRHLLEFTMLEWYTMAATTQDSLDCTISLLQSFDLPLLQDPPEIMSMQEAFARFVDIDLAACIENEKDFFTACRSYGLSAGHTWEDAFHQLFFHVIEPELKKIPMAVLTDYPAALVVLAEELPHTPWRDRWELFVQGLELANCYQEERQPERIASILSAEAKKPQRTPHPIPRDFLQQPSLPACSGVALGVDRLVMLLTGQRDIRQVSIVPDGA